MRLNNVLLVVAAAVSLVGLYLLSYLNYLLFHSVVEVFSIFIIFAIFAVAWNIRHIMDSSYLLFIGIACLFVGVFDLLHTLAYSGMGVFPEYDANLPTQLWLVTRYILSFSFLAAPFFVGRKFRPNLVMAGYVVVSALLLGSIFVWGYFPVAFVDGVGLTSFKVVSEYVISFVFLFSIGLHFRKRQEFSGSIWKFMVAAMAVAVGAEVAFTLYSDVYGLANVIGHLLSFVSFYLVYRALIQSGLTKPYGLLFRNLKQNEITLMEYTSELAETNDRLVQEAAERRKAEKELRKSEKRYRSYIEVTGELGWTTNAEGKVIEDIPSWRSFTGQTFEEIQGSGWSKALHPDDLENTLRVWREAVREKRRYEVEYRVRRRDGVYRLFLARGVPVFKEDGSLREWVGICFDITERKKAEKVSLEQSLVISSATDAIYSTDGSYRIKSWNKAAENLFGWEAGEVIGKVASEILKPISLNSKPLARGKALKNLLNRGFWEGELIYHKKDGSSIPVAVSASLVKDEEGEASGYVAIVHDISRRIHRVEVLREVQRDLNRAQAVARTGSWRIDTQRNVLLWSDENHRIFGIPKGTPMTYETFLDTVHPEDRESVDQRWQAALKGEPYDIEHRIVVDGEVKWVRERAELEFDKSGKLRGGFGTTQEITDIIEMRQKVAEARVKLEEFASRMEELAEERAVKLTESERLAAIGATAGMVGHDIRNPLQAISNDVFLLKSDCAAMSEGKPKQELLDSLVDIEENLDYISKIVRDLQDYAKTLNPDVQKTDLEKITQKVLMENADLEDINAIYVVDDDSRIIDSDPVFLERILTNLVNNAVQAMPDGGKLVVQVHREPHEVVITVQDSGLGISEDLKDKLFTPLFTTKAKGQGFGLAVVKRLTEALGGTVTFESEKGKGTKFVVRLPVVKK